MFVGNCTDETVDYQIDNGGGSSGTLGPGEFVEDQLLKGDSKVQFTLEDDPTARPTVFLKYPTSTRVIVVLHETGQGNYYIKHMKEQ